MKWRYDSSGWRTPIEYLEGKRVIDIGGANSFAYGHLDAVVDIRQPIPGTARYEFVGDVCSFDLLEALKDHADTFGKWDYAICTHTLEDIINPLLVCQFIELIAKEGLIVVPSKFREFSRFQTPYHRGFMHHHWIFDVIDGRLTGFPKFNFIEDPLFDQVNKGQFFEELIVEWEGKINLQYVNQLLPFGTETMSGEDHMKHLYKQMI